LAVASEPFVPGTPGAVLDIPFAPVTVTLSAYEVVPSTKNEINPHSPDSVLNFARGFRD
jgi:hypothetical protein